MRSLLGPALAVALTPLSAHAGGLDSAVPDGVVRVDRAVSHQQVIDAQLVCRDRAYAAAPRDAGRPSPTTTGGLAIGVVGDWRGALTESEFMKATITECMGLRGFTPSAPSDEDRVRFQAIQATGRRVDPYAVIAGFTPAAPRVTTMTETQTASGPARTYTVGRF